MKFETPRIAAEWAGAPVPGGTVTLNPALRQMVTDIQTYAMTTYGWEFFITCLLRTPAENEAEYNNDGHHDLGVHVIGNGGDIRTKDQNPTTVQAVANWVNRQWTYDPSRPHFLVALYEGQGFGSSATHLHIQVNIHTVMNS